MWISQWNGILQYRVGDPNSSPKAPQTLSASASIPNFNARSALPAPQQPSPPQRSVSPVPAARQIPDWPDLPGLVYMGNLVIDNNGKMRRRHFALFDNRLDYFEFPADMASERYPRGRILLRDIKTLNFQDSGFKLFFEDPDLPSMALLADRVEMPTWEMAWTKVGLPRQGTNTAWEEYQQQRQNTMRSNSPGNTMRSNSPVQDARSPPPQPTTRGALLEGQLGLVRTRDAGRPEPRYFVLFPDRLDCFMDEASARRNRVLETVVKNEIQDIDVVEGGFNIISSTRSGRPLKLRALPGLVPTAEDWVEAFRQAFAR